MRAQLRRQRTLVQAAVVNGFGYWTGQDVRVEFRPAPENAGVVFVRSDLGPAKRIPAVLANRIETPRRTTLAAKGARVEMVEHILAALAGMQVDNCEVWVDQPEMPGCDGSSLPFVEAVQTAGIMEQTAVRPQLIVTEPIRVGNEDSWLSATPCRTPGFWIKYRLDYGQESPIGRQTIELKVTPASFLRELAPARTFILSDEAAWLRQQGLGFRVTCKDLLVFDDNGLQDNELRFEDECVRHKALDLIGDLALGGFEFIGQFVAHRTGHRLNAELVRALLVEGRIVEGWRQSA